MSKPREDGAAKRDVAEDVTANDAAGKDAVGALTTRGAIVAGTGKDDAGVGADDAFAG